MRDEFDTKLDMLDSQLEIMGTLVQRQFSFCSSLLENPDKKKIDYALLGDDEIDRQDRVIESLALKLILTQQPIASDLRRISSAIKISGEMERVGDQAVSIADIMQSNLKGYKNKDIVSVSEFAIRINMIVHDAIESCIQHRIDSARKIIEASQDLDSSFSIVCEILIDEFKNNNRKAKKLANLLMILKCLERAGAHSRNICFWVEYEQNGIYKSEPLI